MALTPITEEEFIKIASEEGIPLSLASAMWANESSMGNNRAAFIDPRLKAGKKNSTGTFSPNADKIGYGSMQVIRPTFESVMPGVDYYSATDADLTRAGMRVLKPAVKADGSFDLQKAKNLYFGKGKDSSFGGFSPSTDPKLDARMKSVIEAVDSYDLSAGKTLREAVAGASNQKAPPPVKSDGTLTPSLSTQEAEIKKNQAQELIQFDAGSAQAKFDEAREIKSAELTAILDKQVQAQQKNLDLAEMNPYGAYGQAQETFEALKTANSRLRGVVQDKHFETKPANDGVLGVLELFARKVASDKIYPGAVKEVNDLQKAASDYQQVLSQLMANTAKGAESVSDRIAIDAAASKAGAEALAIDYKAMGIEQKNAQTTVANVRAESAADNRDARTAIAAAQADQRKTRDEAEQERRWYQTISQENINNEKLKQSADRFELTKKTAADKATYSAANLEYKNAQISNLERRMVLDERKADTAEGTARLNQTRLQLGNLKAERALLNDYGTDSLDEITRAANAVLGTTKAKWTKQELDLVVGKDKEMRQKLRDVLAAGGNPAAARDKDVAGNLQRLQTTGSPADKYAATKLWNSFANEFNVQKKVVGINKFSSEKELREKEAVAKQYAANAIAGRETPETNFSANPINVRPLAYWLETAGMQGGLIDTLKEAKIEYGKISGDAELITTLTRYQKEGWLPVSNTQLLTQLRDYYQEFAKLRAVDPVIYEANLPVNAEQYQISTTKGERINLASTAGLVKYVERSKDGMAMMNKAREAARTEQTLNAPLSKTFSGE